MVIIVQKSDYRSDIKWTYSPSYKKLERHVFKMGKYTYEALFFPSFVKDEELARAIETSLSRFLDKLRLPKPFHTFIIGIGNDTHTADSIGPKTLKHLIVNSHLKNMGLPIDGNIISTLEPGVLGETGIETFRIVESIAEEIKPDLVLVIDSLVTDDLSSLGHSIIITDAGLTPGSGLRGTNCSINMESLKVPVISIGIPTALEINSPKKRDNSIYLLSPNDIDEYVQHISRIIAIGINHLFIDDLS